MIKKYIQKAVNWIYFKYWKIKTLIDHKKIPVHDTAMDMIKKYIQKTIDWIYFKHWKIKTLIDYKKILVHDTAMEMWISQNIIHRNQERREELKERQSKITETKLFLEFVKKLKRI